MKISVRELRRIAADVDDLHHDQMRSFREEAAELHLDAARASRRRFLTRAGVGGAALAVGPAFLPGGNVFMSGLAAQTDSLTDTQIAGYAQSIELAAVTAYEMAAPLLSQDILPVAQLFMSHHQDHADAFGSVAGDDARPEANPQVLEALGPMIQQLSDQEGALQFAQTLENQAAYTYAAGLTLLMDPAFAQTAATILPIEAQHATAIGLALGQAPGGGELFPTGAFESASLGDGTDPTAGLDPAVFA